MNGFLLEVSEARHAEFDEHSDDVANFIHDQVGPSLALHISELLIACRQIEQTQGSFGADAAKTVQYVMPKLKALRDKVAEMYRDEQ